MRSLLVVVFSFLFSFNLYATSFDGVYKGDIEYKKTGRKVPFKVLFDLVEDVSNSNRISASKITGSFIVDGEGGPFEFASVDVNIDNGQIIMNYARPQANTMPGMPMNLRFVGYLGEGFKVSGYVLSGRKGHIADFNMSKSEKSSYKREVNYVGLWRGERIMNSGSTSGMELSIASSPSHAVNPNSFDLNYSSGKIGYIKFSSGIRYALSHIYIDYISSELTMIHNSRQSSLILKAKISPEGNLVDGTIESTFGGSVGSFTLSKE